MWFLMRDWVISGGAIPDDTEFKRDLAAPTYEFTSATDIYKLEPKDDIKKRLGKSPDMGDALALTFAFPVHRDAQADAFRLVGLVPREFDHQAVLDYDPHSRM
jgi:hypothetical protein